MAFEFLSLSLTHSLTHSLSLSQLVVPGISEVDKKNTSEGSEIVVISTNKEQGTTVTEHRKPAREHRSKGSVKRLAQPKQLDNIHAGQASQSSKKPRSDKLRNTQGE